jgi:hypothetical protein
MAVNKVLPEMIRSVKLLALVEFTKVVNIGKVVQMPIMITIVAINAKTIRKLITTKCTNNKTKTTR